MNDSYRPVADALLAILVAMYLSLMINVVSALEEIAGFYIASLVCLVLALPFVIYYSWQAARTQLKITNGISTSTTKTISERVTFENVKWKDVKTSMKWSGRIALLMVSVGFILFILAKVDLSKARVENARKREMEEISKYKGVIDGLDELRNGHKTLAKHLQQLQESQRDANTPVLRPDSAPPDVKEGKSTGE